MEHQHYIVRHPLLGYYHFLTAINDEIPALVINTFFGVPLQLLVIHVPQVTKIRLHHNWNFPYQHSSYIPDEVFFDDLRFFFFAGFLEASSVDAFQFDFLQLYIHINLR